MVIAKIGLTRRGTGSFECLWTGRPLWLIVLGSWLNPLYAVIKLEADLCLGVVRIEMVVVDAPIFESVDLLRDDLLTNSGVGDGLDTAALALEWQWECEHPYNAMNVVPYLWPTGFVVKEHHCLCCRDREGWNHRVAGITGTQACLVRYPPFFVAFHRTPVCIGSLLVFLLDLGLLHPNGVQISIELGQGSCHAAQHILTPVFRSQRLRVKLGLWREVRRWREGTPAKRKSRVLKIHGYITVWIHRHPKARRKRAGVILSCQCVAACTGLHAKPFVVQRWRCVRLGMISGNGRWREKHVLPFSMIYCAWVGSGSVLLQSPPNWHPTHLVIRAAVHATRAPRVSSKINLKLTCKKAIVVTGKNGLNVRPCIGCGKKEKEKKKSWNREQWRTLEKMVATEYMQNAPTHCTHGNTQRGVGTTKCQTRMKRKIWEAGKVLTRHRSEQVWRHQNSKTGAKGARWCGGNVLINSSDVDHRFGVQKTRWEGWDWIGRDRGGDKWVQIRGREVWLH